MIVCCAGCQKPITGKFLMTVLDRAWHTECVRCADCGCALTDKCFSREEKLFCRGDFFRRFGTKCSGCLQGISPQDLVRKARNRVFHLKCFTCCVCRKQLSTGEELYVLDENRFVCKQDYVNGNLTETDASYLMSDDEEDMDTMEPGDTALTSPVSEAPSLVHNAPSTPMTPTTPKVPTPSIPPTTDLDKMTGVTIKEEENSDDDLDGDKSLEEEKKGDDDKAGNKRRGPRTTIKAKQLEVLKSAFNKTPKPTRHIREQLAKETGLPMRVIQVWFQNKRSKERRMKQLTSMGMRPHLFANPRKLRDLPLGMEDAYAFFPGYNGFPGQQFPSYFGPQQAIGYPHMGPGMEQPLPPGGPMNGDFPPMTAMNGMMNEAFSQHPTMTSSSDEMPVHGGSGGFSDHTNSEVLAW